MLKDYKNELLFLLLALIGLQVFAILKHPYVMPGLEDRVPWALIPFAFITFISWINWIWLFDKINHKIIAKSHYTYDTSYYTHNKNLFSKIFLKIKNKFIYSIYFIQYIILIILQKIIIMFQKPQELFQVILIIYLLSLLVNVFYKISFSLNPLLFLVIMLGALSIFLSHKKTENHI